MIFSISQTQYRQRMSRSLRKESWQTWKTRVQTQRNQNNQASRNLCTNTYAVVAFTGVEKFYLLHFWKARHGVMKTVNNFTA